MSDLNNEASSKEDNSKSWISIDKAVELLKEDQPVLVTVCNKAEEHWFVDIGRFHNQEGYPRWNTNLGLDEGEEVTHFKINADLVTPYPFG